MIYNYLLKRRRKLLSFAHQIEICLKNLVKVQDIQVLLSSGSSIHHDSLRVATLDSTYLTGVSSLFSPHNK